MRRMTPHGLRLGSIAGTPIFVEPSFFMLCAFFVLIDLQRGDPIQFALLWIPTLFLSVLVHEAAHALTIGALGFGSSVVALGGFGGVTMNERRARPWQDLLISLAGPLASFIFAFLLGLLWANVAFVRQDAMLQHLVPLMRWANIAWGIFNLLPIYPLDGGSVFRNFLRFFSSERTSFVVSVWVSIVVAVGLAILALAFRSFFAAVICAMLAFQNWQRWSAFKELGHGD